MGNLMTMPLKFFFGLFLEKKLVSLSHIYKFEYNKALKTSRPTSSN